MIVMDRLRSGGGRQTLESSSSKSCEERPLACWGMVMYENRLDFDSAHELFFYTLEATVVYAEIDERLVRCEITEM